MAARSKAGTKERQKRGKKSNVLFSPLHNRGRLSCHCSPGMDFRRTDSRSAGSIYKSHSRPGMFERLISVTENSLSPAENMHSIQMTVDF